MNIIPITPVVWVKQQDKAGCVIACLAMITGKTYEETLAEFGRDVSERGIRDWRWYDFLATRGYLLQPKYSGGQLKKEWPPAPWADIHFVVVGWGKEVNYNHGIIMLRNGDIWDPGIEPGPVAMRYCMPPATTKLPEVIKVPPYRKILSVTGIYRLG